MIPHDTIAALEQCWASITALGETLSEEQWKRPTDLPEWSVQDNLSHLVAIERALEGLPRTEHRAANTAHTRNPIGEMNEHEVDARRALSGGAVLDEWRSIVATRLATFAAADEAYFNAEAMTPTGPGTVADFLHIRVLDSWVHEQDMRRAVDTPGNLGGPAAELTVDRLLRTVPIVVGKRAATPEGRAVIVQIGGGVERRVVCEVNNGRAGYVDAPSTDPLCSITLDVETFVVLATGRRTVDDVSFDATGDTAHARTVLSQFNMMI